MINRGILSIRNRSQRKIAQSCAIWYRIAFVGMPKRHDWTLLPTLTSPTDDGGGVETKWVVPEKFVDELPLVLKDAPPLPGEEARYAQINAVLTAESGDPALKRTMIDEATKAERN